MGRFQWSLKYHTCFPQGFAYMVMAAGRIPREFLRRKWDSVPFIWVGDGVNLAKGILQLG